MARDVRHVVYGYPDGSVRIVRAQRVSDPIVRNATRLISYRDKPYGLRFRTVLAWIMRTYPDC